MRNKMKMKQFHRRSLDSKISNVSHTRNCAYIRNEKMYFISKTDLKSIRIMAYIVNTQLDYIFFSISDT